MRADPELKRIAQSIVRKEVARQEVDEETATYFDLELTELRDMFEMRTMILFRRALFQDDPDASKNFIDILKSSARPELIAKIFELLVRHVLPNLSREAKDEIIFGLGIFDESLDE